MVFGKLIGRLTGQDDTPLQPLPLSALVTTPLVDPAVAAQQQQRAAAEAMLRREEIIDSRNRLCGYRFSTAGKSATQADATAENAFLAALAEIDLPAFAARRLALVPITRAALAAGSHLPLRAARSTLLLDVEGSDVEAWLPLLQQAKADGCRLALGGLTLLPEHAPLLALADLALLRLDDYDLTDFQRLARGLKAAAPQLELAADGVPGWPERRMCAAWGFDYCLGPFTVLADCEEPEGKLDNSRVVLMEMLNLIRAEADLADLGAVAKKDPGIALKVLALANSPAAGLSAPVASLEQAIMVLGRQRLYRWLTVAMFRVGTPRDRDEALLEVAMTRARFLETVADGVLAKKDCDELFLVGLLSLFDVLLAMPLTKVLQLINLADEVTAVLLRSEGPYARFLQLALAVEHGRSAQAADIAGELGIDPAGLSNTSQLALAWAEEALGISAPDL
jgi:EAL and modified HD-GYP domain-containing signal transduction protein